MPKVIINTVSFTAADLSLFVENYTAGNIKYHITAWESITSNKFILDIISNGLTIEFFKTPEPSILHPIKFSTDEVEMINLEISTLLSKGVIRVVNNSSGNFLSNVFTVDKKDGGKRMILNLTLSV